LKNIEYKAELRDPDLARAIAREIAATLIVRVQQTDTYYNVAIGRVKKRESVVIGPAVATPEPVEYIVYERPNRIGPRASDFSLLTEAELKVRFGEKRLPVWLTVSKIRELWMWRSVRIHLDKVDHLGWFFEIESLVRESTDEDHARMLADQIRATFAPALGEPVAGSYSDLLAQHRELEPE